MSKLPPHLQELIQGLPPNEAAKVEAAILSSPHLLKQMTKAVREDCLDHIRTDQPNSHRGGYYEGSEKAIYIDSDLFKPGKFEKESMRLDVITGTLGHETQHAFQHKDAREAVSDLSYQTHMKIRDAGGLESALKLNIKGRFSDEII